MRALFAAESVPPTKNERQDEKVKPRVALFTSALPGPTTASGMEVRVVHLSVVD